MPRLNSEFNAAVQLIESGGFAMGECWNKAHEICQKHEDVKEFDRLHAILHLIEGDEFNWNFWLRRGNYQFETMNAKLELVRLLGIRK